MDAAMTLAVLFFCVLLLSSAVISALLFRLCLAALRGSSSSSKAAPVDGATSHAHADADTEAARSAAVPLVETPARQELTPRKVAAEEQKYGGGGGDELSRRPRRLAWREVEALTGGFDEAAVVGRGGSSTVYLARLPDGSPAAVKVHRWCGGGERRLRAFRQELDLLLRRVRHPRIVALLAYSDDHEEGGALLLEYVSGGTLADSLHGGAAVGAGPPLSWPRRMRVVRDVAVALEQLHDDNVVHGDVSASNVLLDGGGARLCDLGSACEGTFSAAVAPARGAAAVGSPGYADPFFLRTGIVSKKSDVYSFGVLLLEAVTGSPAAGTGSPDADGGSGKHLVSRILPRIRSAAGVQVLVDSRLGTDYDATEAGDVVKIAVECVEAQPGLRPTMAQVRAAIAEKAARSITTAEAGGGGDIKLHDLLGMTIYLIKLNSF